MPWGGEWLAPPWFEPGWFLTGDMPEVGIAVARDTHVMADIAARLLATREFTMVEIGRPEEIPASGQPKNRPAAFIWPRSGGELDRSSGPVTADNDHEFKWTLSIIVNAQIPRERYSNAERLLNVAMNVLDDRSLADLTWPGRTKIRGWVYQMPAPADLRLDVQGEWFYQLAGFRSHNTGRVTWP